MPSPQRKIGLIILAAGSSRRMNGQPKQLLEYAGKTLLRRAVESAVNANFEKIVVVLGLESDQFVKEIEDLPVVSIINENTKLGISSSIKVGLSTIAEIDLDAVLIMLCDQPLITAMILQNIIELHFLTGKSIVACRYENTFGVPALFARELFPELMSLSADEGAKKIIKKHLEKADFLDAPEAGLDIDTIEDYHKLLQ
jgi:molybdenum cofactor cytidylyltransferase